MKARLQRFENFFTFVHNPYTGQTGVMTQGRFGVMTEYWMKEPLGQGAAFSVGTVQDRYGCFVEVEAVSCPDNPTTVYYGHMMHTNPTQKNIVFESHVGGSSVANVDLQVSGQGIEVVSGLVAYYIGQLGGIIRKLWPA